MSQTRVPAIPAPTDANLRDVARAIKGVLDVREGLSGDPLDANVTFRDLADGGVIQVTAVRRGGGSGSVVVAPGAGLIDDGYDPTADLTPPPAPTGFTATGLFAGVVLSWSNPPASYANHAYTEIWRASPTFTGTPPTEVAPVLGNAVLIGVTDTSMYTDYLGNNEIQYYWIRFVSQADVKGPYNATAGTRVITAQNPGLLIDSLSNSISTSQLTSALNGRINLIDGAISLPGSVNERINTSQNAVTALVTVPAYDAGKAYAKGELATYSGNLYKATTTTQGNLPTDTSKWKVVGQYSSLANSFSAAFTDYLTTTETNSAISSATNGLVSTTALNTALGNYVTTSTLTNDYYTKTGTDGAISSATQNLVSNTGLSTALSAYTTTANLTANYYTKTATDSAISSATQNLVSTTGLSNTLSNYVTSAALTTNYYTKTATDSAISSATQNLVSTTTLNNTLGSYATTVALQTLATTTAGPNGTTAQYTVKVDNNGYVTGFGLSSTANNSTPTSNFGVRADAFYIANPAGPGIAPAMPFIVRTTSTTINGVTVPVGVYITDGFIQNGTITNAKIANLAVDEAKIANLSVTNGKIADAAITNAKISGTIQSDNYVAGVSGWSVSKASGFAEFGAASIRGQLTASQINGDNLKITAGGVQLGNDVGPSAGHYGLSLSGSDFNNIFLRRNDGVVFFRINDGGDQSLSFNSSDGQLRIRGQINGGAYSGYSWPASGTGFHLGPAGLLLGNYNVVLGGGKRRYFQIEASGNVYSPGFNIIDGDAVFSGTISGAIVNTDQIVGGAAASAASATSTGSSASVTVNVPANASAILIEYFLGPATATYTGGGGKDGGGNYTYGPILTGLTDNGNTTGAIIVSPGAGNHTITVSRSYYSGTMRLGVVVLKR